MEQIWKLVAEVLVEPGDLPSGQTKGFMNVTTWADSADSAAKKPTKYIEQFNWLVISIEDARTVVENEEYSEQIEDMIARTRANPEASLLSELALRVV